MNFHEAAPSRYPNLRHLMESALQDQQAVNDAVLQMSSGSMVNAGIGLNLLGVGTGFPGYSSPVAVSDVNLAVGDTQVVQWVNEWYAVFDKSSGAIIAGAITGTAFWSGFGAQCGSYQQRRQGDALGGSSVT